ncbi:MAG: EMC3/TMCO1 family protein [Candidatus Aenigmarchaeota archaeon]|nr:EMC3/TMCO1 family protein [Candidatus Aenigmarchaeota archaeon]
MIEFLLKPHIILLIISSALTVFIVFLNRILVNKKVVQEIKARMAEIRENITRAQREGDMESANKLLSEMLKVNSEYMKQSLKVLVASIIVISLAFPLLGSSFSGLAVSMPFELPFIGSKLNWIGWYVLVSFAIGWVVRKILEVE